MPTIDLINNKYTRGTIKLASEGVSKSWAMRRELKKPRLNNYIERDANRLLLTNTYIFLGLEW